MEDEICGWSDVFVFVFDGFEKGVAFIDLPLTMTIEHNLSALNFRPAKFRAFMHRENRVWTPEIVEELVAD